MAIHNFSEHSKGKKKAKSYGRAPQTMMNPKKSRKKKRY